MVKLNKNQLSESIFSHLKEDSGLNEILQMTFEGLMKLERDELVRGDSNNKGNGYRLRQSLGLGEGYKIRIPRDRLGVFQPYLLELLKQDEERIKEACFELYAKGLTTKDVGEIVHKLYGKTYSESSISNITTGYYEIMEKWRNRALDKHYAVVYIDAIFVKVKRDSVESEAFYVALGVKEDATREVLGIYNYPTESSTNWIEIFKQIEHRGVSKINLLVSDGLKGIEEALKQVYPSTPLQTCIVHYERNIMREVRPKDKEEFGKDFKNVFQADKQEDRDYLGKERLKTMAQKWKSIYPKLSVKMLTDADNKPILFTYLQYDYRVRRMIYTTNWIERLNKKFRKTLKVRGSLPSVESVLVLLSKSSIDIGNDVYSYPVSALKNDKTLFQF